MTQRIEAIKTLKTMFAQDGMSFKNEEEWNTLAEHVEVHNLYLTKDLKFNVSWDDALFSWYENVYTPLNQAISTWSFRHAFKDQLKGDLYLAVSDRWLALKEKYENVEAIDAAYNYIHTNRNKDHGVFSKVFGTHFQNRDVSFHRPAAA